MLRWIVLFVFFFVLTLTTGAQAVADTPAEAPPNISRLGRPAGRISIRRLKESHRLQRLYNKALDAWRKRKASEAQRRLEEALALDPEFPEALTFCGGIHAFAREWSLAEDKLRAAIQSDPTYSPAYVVLAGVYNSQRRFDDAQQATNQALAAGADTWDVQYEMARVLIGKQQYEKAVAITDAALRLKQHGSLLHLAKAHALIGMRKYPEAVAELRVYLHDQPSGDGSRGARDLLQEVQNIVAR